MNTSAESTVKSSEKQDAIYRNYLLSRPKIQILEGAVRSGKTVLNNRIFIRELAARAGQNKNIIITGHTIGSIKRNVIDPMCLELGRTIRLDNHGCFELFGNKVHCFGADKMDSYKHMTGMTAAGWYGNEVSLQHANSIQEAFNRCSEENAFILWDTNPDYPEHPIKVDFIDKSGEKLSNGRTRIQSYHFSLEDNPFLPAEYIENLKRSTPKGIWYDRAIKGLWVQAEGLVYEGFSRDIHVVQPFDIPKDWQHIRGIDFGYTNPFVCLWGAVDHDGRLFIYDEHYKPNMLIKDHARQINIRGDGCIWTVADHDAQERAELQEAGIGTAAADKDIEHGIQLVARRLVEQPDGYPHLMVFGTCKNVIREFGVYRWEERKEGKAAKEEPHKENDHAMDTIRYMVMRLDRHKAFISDIVI